MSGVSPENLRLALAVTTALLVIFVLRQAFLAWLRRGRIVSRLMRPRKGESRARTLLEAAGYAILGAQFNCTYTLSIDGEDIAIPLRADYIVSRNGLRYVAEVKTGAYAPHLATPATRRQ